MAVLFQEDVFEGPETEVFDVAKFAVSRHKVRAVLALGHQFARHFTEQFHNLRQMVIVFRVILAGMRFEEQIARQKFKNKTRQTPHVNGRIVCLIAYNDFGCSVMSRLNVIRKVAVREARISKIGDFAFEGAVSKHTQQSLLVSWQIHVVSYVVAVKLANGRIDRLVGRIGGFGRRGLFMLSFGR